MAKRWADVDGVDAVLRHQPLHVVPCQHPFMLIPQILARSDDALPGRDA
jgi:hypothetical protein